MQVNAVFSSSLSMQHLSHINSFVQYSTKANSGRSREPWSLFCPYFLCANVALSLPGGVSRFPQPQQGGYSHVQALAFEDSPPIPFLSNIAIPYQGCKQQPNNARVIMLIHFRLTEWLVWLRNIPTFFIHQRYLENS